MESPADTARGIETNRQHRGLIMSADYNVLDDFEHLLHGVQATRRWTERLACPIQGAAGARVQFYPHQIQNVQRILSATRIRHLIADEVGMGKMVQALMIANSLRLQLGRLRVRVIVGRTELQRQWIEEVASRIHVTAELDADVIGDSWFDVVWDSSITSLAATLDARVFDLLILDEPQSLRADLLRHIAEHSIDYPRLLLLTASPELRKVQRVCELLQMIEPERIERVRWELFANTPHNEEEWYRSALRGIDPSTLETIRERFLSDCSDLDVQGHGALKMDELSDTFDRFPAYRKKRFLSDARWKYRNVLRAYRADFPRHLPRRKLESLTVEPTFPERQRMELMRRYLADTSDFGDKAQRDAALGVLRRVALGGESLLIQIRELRRKQPDQELWLSPITDLSRKDSADARLDELVDWLSQFWRDDPKRKVVVAAQDNPTVDELYDELSWRLPEVGERGNRKPLHIDKARDERGSSDQTPLEAVASSQVRDFEHSDVQLLIAHDSFREGHNFQSADALVFYGLPWEPESLDQWIGRVDRLGREFLDPENRRSPPKPVRIITLHRRSDPTEIIERVYHHYRVFEVALDPDPSLLQSITQDIHRELFDYRRSGESVGGDDSEQAREPGRETAPPRGSMWTVERALELFNEFLDRPVSEPVLRQTKPLGYVCCEEEAALASWLRQLVLHRKITIVGQGEKQVIRKNRSLLFYTLSQDAKAVPSLSCLQDHRQSFPAFFVSRRNIQRPPRLKVETGQLPDGSPRIVPLQFLSHGAPLHEELVLTFMKAGRRRKPIGITLYTLGQSCYPNGTELSSGVFLCVFGFVDSGIVYVGNELNELVEGEPLAETGSRIAVMREYEVNKFRAGLEADARFVRILASTYVACLAWRVTSGNSLTPCSQKEASDLFTPRWRHDQRPLAEPFSVPEDWTRKVPSFCSREMAKRAREHWAVGRGTIRERIEERVEMIRLEAEDALWNLRAAMAEAQRRIQSLRVVANASAEQTIRTNYEPRLRLLAEQVELICRGRDLRCRLLHRSLGHIEEPSADTVYLQATCAIRLLPEPVVAHEDEQTPTSEQDATGKSILTHP